MEMKKKSVISFLLILSFLTALVPSAFAADNRHEIRGSYTYFPTLGILGVLDNQTETFTYCDDWFLGNGYDITKDLALISLNFTQASFGKAFVPEDRGYENQKEFLTKCGFEGYDCNYYFKNQSEFDSMAVGCAHKKLSDGSTLLAVGTRGHNYLKEWAGKLPGNVLRIAALLTRVRADFPYEAFRNPFLEPEPDLYDDSDEEIYASRSSSLEVDESTMANAVLLGRYYLANARKAFSLMGSSRLNTDCRYVLEKILEKRYASFTSREIFRVSRRFAKMDGLKYFVNQIVEYIIHNGMMSDMSVLQSAPFTNMGSVVEVFTDVSLWMRIKNTIAIF